MLSYKSDSHRAVNKQFAD